MPAQLRLIRDLTQPINPPALPAGTRLVAFSSMLAPQVHALMRLAYESGGGDVPSAFDTWWAATRHDAEFDAGLCFVATGEAGPAGLVLCWTSGFIKDVVVHPDWRRQGLATALLLHALRTLAARGHREVALKVHADNLGAQRLYARLGFRNPELP